MTVLEIIQRSTDYLARKGVESPRLQTELLLAEVLGMPRLQLYLNFERVVTDPELTRVRELVRRRGNREPLQHLTGSTSFCGIEIAVSREVLIPRPETEVLAERAWKILDGWAAAAPSVLDFGTGSGCLAIALAHHCPAARITAVDVSETALELARANAVRLGLADRLEFLRSDAFASVPKGTRFDLIVANPPYIPSAELAGLAPEVRDHDPRAALDGGPDGLDVIRRLAGEGGAFLRTSGWLLLEFGDGQEAAVEALFLAAGWSIEGVEPDLSGRPRIFVARPGGK